MATTRDAVATEHGRHRTVGSRRRRAGFGLTAVVALAVACSGPADPVAAPTGTPILPASATTAAHGTTRPRWSPEQQEVVDAYRAAVDAELQAALKSDPELPALVNTHDGAALDDLRNQVRAQQSAGQRTRLPDGAQFRI